MGGGRNPPLWGGLQFYDSAFQRNRHGMSSVVSAQFGQDVLNMPLDGFFGDPKMVGHYFVCLSGRDQSEHFYFTRGQGLIGGVFRNLPGNFRRDTLLASMDGTDRVQKFSAQQAL